MSDIFIRKMLAAAMKEFEDKVEAATGMKITARHMQSGVYGTGAQMEVSFRFQEFKDDVKPDVTIAE